MPQYLSPGVYVEEVPSGNAPIAGASTSTPGFVGFVDDAVAMPVIPGRFELDDTGALKKDSDGNPIPVHFTVAPAMTPVLVTSWAQFKNSFGDFQDLGLGKTPTAADLTAAEPKRLRNAALAHAVFGFFDNGGSRAWVVRVGGTAGADDAAVATAVAGKVTAALNALGAVDEIALIAVPGVTDGATQKLIYQHCESMGDRFAILDGPNARPGTMTPDGFGGGARGTSNYAAIYYPWIQVMDPSTGGKRMVAPSGHIAGLYARVDGEKGVHKAPANEVVRGAVGLADRVSKAEQDGLNPAGYNMIREFNGNIKVWGARTLGGDANTEWKYVNVRRVFLYLRKSIDSGTHWTVFEPNTPALWQKIVRNVNAFLTNVWRAGALFGSTAPEAFFVRCDATTNPPELRDLGQVVTEIGVAVVRPAEFVIFRISQWQPGA
ncbi:MAG TPA: phage tail sheath subtilisin-like domain-containing protein [Longimicrobiaceae bacterium]|nr:phage tail sheath subtilisin-like domain-containing protein [Longimicrobiaceae bacterium]